jgi:hypothetical protein
MKIRISFLFVYLLNGFISLYLSSVVFASDIAQAIGYTTAVMCFMFIYIEFIKPFINKT